MVTLITPAVRHCFKKSTGSRVVMTAEDWQIARARPDLAALYADTPIDIVAKDGDTITLGNNTVTLFNTPDTLKAY